MAYDNICKYLAEEYPSEFARWLLAQEIADIQVLKTELSVEPIRADSLTLLQTRHQILHLEFQIGEVDPQLQERIQGLPIPLLEELSEALLDFEVVADLATWLDEYQSEESAIAF